MDRNEARDTLAALVSADTAPVLSQVHLDHALDKARVRDQDGRAPVDDGYVETFSLDHAAAAAFEQKAVLSAATDTGGIESFSEEGASWRRSKGSGYSDFMALARHYRANAARGGSTIHVIPIEAAPTATPRSAEQTGMEPWRT